jgi:hypothetical protein
MGMTTRQTVTMLILLVVIALIFWWAAGYAEAHLVRVTP